MSMPYIYNERKIPSEPVPSDVSEWSRDIFSNRVCQLVRRAFESAAEAKKMSISTLTGVVTNIDAATSAGLTVYDFMTTQGIFDLQPFTTIETAVIPFFGQEGERSGDKELNASALIKKILSDNKEWHEEVGLNRAGAVMAGYELNIATWNDSKEMLEKLIEKY